MTDESRSGESRSFGDAEDLLRRVRQIDPKADEEAVRRYAREIAEADAELRVMELDNALPVAAFSPAWNSEQDR